MSAVRLEHLTKTFPGGAAPAVDDVSLTIRDGEFLVLVGPSGCGKSTILRMIAGLEDTTFGDVVIDGQKVTDWAPKQRDIAMVFQNYALYPHMTVAENMGFALRLRRRPKPRIREQVEDTAHLLGLEEYLERKPKALSGGQRQRVAMGRALVRRPRVFLLDEPLSNLDAKLRVSMRAELARLHQRYRVTTVYVTHDQVEAMTLGDRIAVLNRGRLQQVGTPEELYLAPANRFVAGFMGSPSMNFATVVLHDGDPVTMSLDGAVFPFPDVLRRCPDLAGRFGEEIVLGLRPAAFSLAGPDSAAVVEAVPLGVEALGDEKHVLFEAPHGGGAATSGDPGDVPVAVDESSVSRLWTAKVQQHAGLAIGRPVRLALDLSAAYFFDAADGYAIPRREPEPVAAGVSGAGG
ncbi:multiple sugar transport system ATP-binding protein [Actinoplanes campanulatus]|uniref:Multiple sugar transport system ATP-binding protein n=1 Tax=Actinoplanes campanulatus TaxID=113559 RepID=A0A7W5ASJ3_9ACTN|nr:ABC transporter ATP-binding protein [Actinoplanes campanulatus]MBB3101505.1 multiple sugar transport system ATP-binding protein [Actinoplanes campanulatus]GGN50538.1 ABC transporter ATP-binding protein [Actinoplanes campanulatus]GID42101.1 ABC transporter ATP-binding protein [Actinoplanes campanulatus]